jgi:hypothetical protein
VVACVGVPCGDVTAEVDPLVEEWERWEELRDEAWVERVPLDPSDVPAEEPSDDAWVAAPIPSEAPMAPRTPSATSPACNRLLRVTGVMPRRCGQILWASCENRGAAVSVA